VLEHIKNKFISDYEVSWSFSISINEFFKKNNRYNYNSIIRENIPGTKMVRKFMVWKTNKEVTGEYPAYVYHYTDFSAGRAEMLKKEIKVSNSKKQIEEIFAAEVLKNVKKGWEKVGY